jgi:hypothetical protein
MRWGSSERILEVATYREGGMAVFRVSDTGSGLSETARESLYHAFFSTKIDGMGVGLSISRTIVELHGGQIWTEENDGAACASISPCHSVPLLTEATSHWVVCGRSGCGGAECQPCEWLKNAWLVGCVLRVAAFGNRLHLLRRSK